MYVKLDGGIVAEIIPDIDLAFPDVPIVERYPADFIAGLMHIDDGAKVEISMEYDAETGSFRYPEAATAPGADEETIEDTGSITQAEINLDVEYRLACLELGIN